MWNRLCSRLTPCGNSPAAACPGQAPGCRNPLRLRYHYDPAILSIKGKGRSYFSFFSYDSLFDLPAVLSIHLLPWLQTSISTRSSFPLLSKKYYFRIYRIFCVPKDTPLCRLTLQNITILLWTCQGTCSTCIFRICNRLFPAAGCQPAKEHLIPSWQQIFFGRPKRSVFIHLRYITILPYPCTLP